MRTIRLGLLAVVIGLGADARADSFLRWSDGFGPNRTNGAVLLADEPGAPPARPAPRRAAPPPQEPPPAGPPPAAYQPSPPPPPPLMRWYAMLSAGVLIPKTTDFQAGGFVGQVDWGIGGSAFLGIGYHLDEYWAVELEGGYLYIPVDGLAISAATGSVDGTSHNLALFGNLVLRAWPYWTVFDGVAIATYIAGGPGVVHQFDTSFTAVVDGTTVTGDVGGRTAFAMQGKIGVDFRITERISLAPEYRFIWVTAGESIGHSYIHSVGGSLKYRF